MFFRMSILSFWSIVDPFYYLFTRLQYLGTSKDSKAIFRVRLTKYKGRDMILADGTQIKKNDILVKIHLHNVRILKELKDIKSPLQKGKKIYKLVHQSMPLLAQYVNSHPENAKIKGIIGITMINKGVKSLGFETFLPKNSFYKTFKHITQLPIYFLSCSSPSFENFREHNPVYLVMSKDSLCKKYKLN